MIVVLMVVMVRILNVSKMMLLNKNPLKKNSLQQLPIAQPGVEIIDKRGYFY